MNYELITAVSLFAFAASGTPGPNNLLLLTSGANFGYRRSVPHMAGVVIGFFIMVMLIGVGLMQLFNAFPVSYWILKFASITYLLFLAWKIATAVSFDDNSPDKTKGKPFTLLQAALFQWVNPKGWAMALTAISAYAPSADASSSRPLAGVFLVAIIFTLVNVITTSVWTALGMQLRKFLSNPRKLRIFNISIALLLIGSLYPILFQN